MTSLFEPSGMKREVMPLDFMVFEDRGLALLEFGLTESADLILMGEPEEEAERDAELLIISSKEPALQISTMIEEAQPNVVAEPKLSLENDFLIRFDEERAKVAKMCVDFIGERQRYFAAAESEVVRLALAIAERVLSREISSDPMYLTETIKLALSKVQDGSRTRLRVREQESAAWTQVFAEEAQLEVVIDVRLASGECVLETKVGHVALGVCAQLGEIDRNFSEWMGSASIQNGSLC